MSDKPDTTREAVERLAATFDHTAELFRSDMGKGYNVEGIVKDAEDTATTLRSLAADNDALRAEVANILAENDALRFTLNNVDAALRQAVERARGEALEEAAAEADCGCAWRPSVMRFLADPATGEREARRLCPHDDVCCAIQAATIRARAGGAGDE